MYSNVIFCISWWNMCAKRADTLFRILRLFCDVGRFLRLVGSILDAATLCEWRIVALMSSSWAPRDSQTGSLGVPSGHPVEVGACSSHGPRGFVRSVLRRPYIRIAGLVVMRIVASNVDCSSSCRAREQMGLHVHRGARRSTEWLL
jgi:hypothetical protein